MSEPTLSSSPYPHSPVGRPTHPLNVEHRGARPDLFTQLACGPAPLKASTSSHLWLLGPGFNSTSQICCSNLHGSNVCRCEVRHSQRSIKMYFQSKSSAASQLPTQACRGPSSYSQKLAVRAPQALTIIAYKPAREKGTVKETEARSPSSCDLLSLTSLCRSQRQPLISGALFSCIPRVENIFDICMTPFKERHLFCYRPTVSRNPALLRLGTIPGFPLWTPQGREAHHLVAVSAPVALVVISTTHGLTLYHPMHLSQSTETSGTARVQGPCVFPLLVSPAPCEVCGTKQSPHKHRLLWNQSNSAISANVSKEAVTSRLSNDI